ARLLAGAAAVAAVGAVLGLPGLDVARGRRVAVGGAGLEKACQRRLVGVAALGLGDRPLVPVELEPAEGVEDLLDVLRGRALAVGVLYPQHQLAVGVARRQPVVEGGP